MWLRVRVARDLPRPPPLGQLLARVYELDPLRCLGCDGTLRILAFLTDPPAGISTATRPLWRSRVASAVDAHPLASST